MSGKSSIHGAVVQGANEYVQYAVDIERTFRELEQELVSYTGPKETALKLIQIATEFYDADQCGIIDVDREADTWTPYWWYSRKHGEMASSSYDKAAFTECIEGLLPRLQENTPVILSDVGSIRSTHPDEYAHYRKSGIRSLLAVPFWRRPTSFLLVLNPQKYKGYLSLLQVLNYALVTALNKYLMVETCTQTIVPPNITRDKDVYISMFGDLKIVTAKGTLTENDLHSPKIARLLVYLVLSKKAASAPREIADAIWPEEECDGAGKNMKGLVYRLQQAFSLISEHRLIKSTTNGYQINPELNIITDIQQFDHKLCSALNAFSNAQKTELLKKAVDLYEGDLLTSASAEHWLMSASVNYQHRYVGAVTELMKALEHDKKYRCMQVYASKALTIVPIDPGLYFWLIHSLHKQGHTGIARSELHAAKIKLLEEDYADLLEHLQHVGFDAKRSYHTFFSPVGTLIDPMGY